MFRVGRTVVRISLLFLLFLCSSVQSGAMPKLGGAESNSLVVRVDEDSPLVWKPTQAECERFPHWAPDDYCRRYRRANEGQAQEQARSQPLAQPGNPDARRGMGQAASTHGKHDRDGAAVNPRTAAIGAKPRAAPSDAGESRTSRLRTMVGQLVIAGFSGRSLADPGIVQTMVELREGKLSGVLIRDSNVQTYFQLRELVSHFTQAGGALQPLIAIEQPGGDSAVLSEEKGFAPYEAANTIRSLSNPHDALLIYQSMASELSSLGISLNIGPAENACRDDDAALSAPCFGTALPRVAAFARAFSYGQRSRGVLAALTRTPLPPRRAPRDNERPSSAILRAILAGAANDAVVLRIKATDALLPDDTVFDRLACRDGKALEVCTSQALIVELDMGIYGTPVNYGEAIVRAIASGADMVLLRDALTMPPSITSVVYEAVKEAIHAGRLDRSRIEAAYEKVQRLKARLRLLQPEQEPQAMLQLTSGSPDATLARR
jgi:beta-N-acetylhexosaminidase